eukprot:TRINITY_DN754_c0_g1_i1.p1 TRINITY_DN754_c0_g1~~TRINITY_DN754_c0_g1_i1.p1  ORF type:complete len:361 (-),score=126.98 TRINITY_DN754_c0_g1_i1:53-1135(-)
MPSDDVVVAPAPVATQSQDEQYKLVNRVLSYPTVSHWVGVSKEYYTYAKDNSSLVKSVSENLERQVETGTKLYRERVAPSVGTVVSPVLSTVDTFGCKQLDRMENLGEVYQSSKKSLETKVVELRDSGSKYTSQLPNAVPALDNYLKTTPYLGPVLNAALNVTERVADRVLPSVEVKEGEKKENEGPVYRAANLTVRVGSGLSAGLQDLRVRTPEVSKQSLQACLNLVNKAKENLTEGVQYLESLKNLNEVSEKVKGFTQESYKSLLEVYSVLSAQVPENLREKSTKTLNGLASRKEVVAFTDVLKANAAKLQSATEALSEYIKKNEKLPNQLASVTDALNTVLESLVSKSPKLELSPKQ